MSRIAMVSDSFLPRSGGIELHVRDLSIELVKAGHDVHVISPFAGDSSTQSVAVRQLQVALWPRFSFAWTPSAVYKLESQLRAGAYEVAHHHISIFSPLTVASIGLCLQLGIPTVVTGHSLWREYARALGWLDRLYAWSSKPLVTSAVSRAVAADLAPYAGTNPVEHLPNGIDVQFWKARPRNDRSSRAAIAGGTGAPPKAEVLQIVSVLRLARRKRPRVLLDIVSQILQRQPDVAFLLRIVGEGNERPHLEAIIRERGLEANVQLMGSLSRAQIRELFAGSDLFVLPTAEEAFGIAALEARTAGLPVVAMNTGGVGEIIQHDVEGLLASVDDELVDHTLALLTNNDLRLRISNHNANTAPREGWAVVVAHHERAYNLAVHRMRSHAIHAP